MTTPNVPYRMEVDLVVPGTPAQVWDAISTAEGCSAWMMPTTGTGELGGELVFHMGPEMDSPARITALEPQRRMVYEEAWADLAAEPDANVTPLVTEFLIEAQSGGTCAVKIVTSAFGIGADWENEFFSHMSEGWGSMLDNLRVYLTRFPGQHVTPMVISATFPVSPSEAIAMVRSAFGVAQAGDTFSVRGANGTVERSVADSFFVHFDAPIPGFATLFAFAQEHGSSVAMQGHLFSSEAADYVEREQPGWQAWLDGVAERTGAVTH
ncbi:MAG: SRPBCC domain-containing protein [Acidimicrobiales bacterium]|nr:SRPBCC domain-containing protein [Acidimicrobiales bacterium]